MYRRYIKRLLDVLFAVVISVPSVLIILVCCIAIKLESKGPAFFVQERPGYKGKIFKIYKLRTMILETERDGRLLTDMERMTKTGALIRKYSFDELGQLLNIFKREMSFIGPRPLLVNYLPLYNEKQMRRHDVLPGISGWAQVNGRNSISWENKFELDIWYIEHMSVMLDLKIAYLTIYNIVKRKNINNGTTDTMPVFTGETKMM